MLIQAWEKFLHRLENEMGADSVDRWLRTMRVLRYDAGNFYLEARDAFQVRWFDEHARPRANEWFVRSNGKPIVIHLEGPGIAAPKVKGAKGKTKPQAVVPTPPSFHLISDGLDPLCTFEHFHHVEGDLLAYKILNEVSGDRSEKDRNSHLDSQLAVFNPVYVHGRSGTGKTHFLMATAHALRKKGLRAVYVRAETFTENVVAAIRAGEMTAFRQFYRACDVLLVDDVHLFARKAATQEEFFHTFNTLHVAGTQIILSASCAPQELQLIEPRLVSRFEWGIVMPLEFLKPADCMEVLRIKAAALNFSMNKHVEEFLHKHFDSHPKALCQALEALVLRSHLQNSHGTDLPQALTVNDLRHLLADFLADQEKKTLRPEQILLQVSENYGIRVEDILGRGQTRDTVLPRQLAMYFCREQLKMPFSKIGELFNRDHSTVMTSIRQIQQKLEETNHPLVAVHSAIHKKLLP